MSRIFEVVDDLLIRAGLIVLISSGYGGVCYGGLGWASESRWLVWDDILTRT